MTILRFIVAGLVVGILAINSGKPSNLNDINLVNDPDEYYLMNPNAYNASSAMFIIITVSFTGLAFAVPYLKSHFKILRLEASAGLHSTLAGYLSAAVIELPIVTLAALCLGGCIHGFMQLSVNRVYIYGTVVSVILTGYSLAAACGCWASSPFQATFSFAASSVLLIVFSGYLQPLCDMNVVWKWAVNFQLHALCLPEPHDPGVRPRD